MPSWLLFLPDSAWVILVLTYALTLLHTTETSIDIWNFGSSGIYRAVIIVHLLNPLTDLLSLIFSNWTKSMQASTVTLSRHHRTGTAPSALQISPSQTASSSGRRSSSFMATSAPICQWLKTWWTSSARRIRASPMPLWYISSTLLYPRHLISSADLAIYQLCCSSFTELPDGG